ncbi:HlyD family efflux transporter periplasmic adaptor subunit [Paenibacillus periandrae]|uniref:HlyD family efflux transporter periplasmic adaptor subunit n=1 Tax=Paenibacillus periandrae TaxID=1761741 RepID=UPI001F09AFC3|nr:HlyD family efflux transporter periplasmic adaptor subunit [Paenibacillus periandrae]
MKPKWILYVVIALVLIAGGSLLVAKGKDAVSQAENRKQGVLDAESKTIVYDKKPGTLEQVHAGIGDFVKKGDILFKLKSAEGSEEKVLSPDDGLVNRIAVKSGEQLMPGMPVAVVQKTEYYTDLFVQEGQIEKLKLNQTVKIHFPYLNRPIEVEGTVASIAAAPQFASLRMTREKGQADVSMFVVRISVPSNADLLPGMTAEVDFDEIAD